MGQPGMQAMFDCLLRAETNAAEINSPTRP
jgi:hypothetical protein